jgi:hypothetical protein
LSAADRKHSSVVLRTLTGGRVRGGGRWSQLAAGEGSTGLTPTEAAEAARAAARTRTERTQRAAATRRAAARTASGGGPG